MSYYRVCPGCGAHLDPGETCDCKEKTAADAANIDDGKAEQTRSTVSASNHTTDKEDFQV